MAIVLAAMCIMMDDNMLWCFSYIIFIIKPNTKAYIIFIGDRCIRENIRVVMRIDFFIEYLFFNLL